MGIYLKYGCLGFEIFRSVDEWCIEINRFESKEHYESVMKSLDLDPEIEALWNEFCSLIGTQDVLTKEYERRAMPKPGLQSARFSFPLARRCCPTSS
jgi:hypothetical protein